MQPALEIEADRKCAALCVLIARNNNSVPYEYSGQALAPNEEYFKVNMGGFASAVTINYAFGNW